MTDRVRSLTVALERDFREDDVEPLLAAIALLRGVLTVTPHVVKGNDWTTEQRVRFDLSKKLYDVLESKP